MKKIVFFVAAMMLATIMFSCKTNETKKTDPTNPTENPTDDPKEDPKEDPTEEDVYPEIGARNCILLEEFTGQTCPNCPRAIAAIRETIDAMSNGDKVAWVAHHSGYYDDFFTLTEDLTVASKFGVNYAPAGMLERTKMKLTDGNSLVHLADYMADADLLNEYIAKPAEASISLKVGLSADNTLSVKVLGKSNKETAYITVLLCQNGLRSAQSGASESTYTHNEVVRAYLTAAVGDKLTIDGDKKFKFTTTYQIPETISGVKNKAFATDIPNMYIVAFVHGKANKTSDYEVYNTDQVKLSTLVK